MSRETPRSEDVAEILKRQHKRAEERANEEAAKTAANDDTPQNAEGFKKAAYEWGKWSAKGILTGMFNIAKDGAAKTKNAIGAQWNKHVDPYVEPFKPAARIIGNLTVKPAAATAKWGWNRYKDADRKWGFHENENGERNIRPLRRLGIAFAAAVIAGSSMVGAYHAPNVTWNAAEFYALQRESIIYVSDKHTVTEDQYYVVDGCRGMSICSSDDGQQFRVEQTVLPWVRFPQNINSSITRGSFCHVTDYGLDYNKWPRLRPAIFQVHECISAESSPSQLQAFGERVYGAQFELPAELAYNQ